MSDRVHNGSRELDEQAYEWVACFARGDGRRADVDALQVWMAQSDAHAEAFERVSRAWATLRPIAETLAARGAISPRRHPTGRVVMPAQVRLARRAVIGGALAASAAALSMMHPPLGLWPSWAELAANIRTQPGEQRRIQLADHVAVHLNTRTSLDVTAPDGREARLISGEALVSSSPQASKPFTLLAGEGRIVTRDARFNVRLDERGVCVTCVAGGIDVLSGGTRVSLSAGRQTRYLASGISQPDKVDAATIAAWDDGMIVFEATPVSDVVTEVNRYRSGRIILTNATLGRRLFDARLRIENVARIVHQIELTFGARATELPGGIVLLG